MVNCYYLYHGHKFNSEIELDDFLLADRDALYTKYGDLVFQSEANAETCALLAGVSADSLELLEQYDRAKKEAVFVDGEPIYEFKPPYIGVTKFLSGLTNSRNVLLSPEFREFSYWSKRIEEWKDETKGFNDDEIELFGKSTVITDSVTPEGLEAWLKDYEKLKKSGKPIPEPSNQILKLIKLMKEKWEYQGKVGTSIHEVLRHLFTEMKSGSNKGKLLLELNEDTIINTYFNGTGKNRYNKDYLNEEHLRDIIKYAKTLRTELTNTFGTGLTFFPEFQISTKLAVPVEGKGDTILGIIDLLVVDNDGNAHVIDYKASPKDSFDTAKERSFWYLLGLYNRMLINNNIRTDSDTPQVMVAPIKMLNLRKQNSVFVFDHVEKRDEKCLLDITANSTLTTVANNLDEFVPIKRDVVLAPEKVIENVTKFNSKSFPEISTSKTWTDDDILKLINKRGGFVYNEKDKRYSIKLNEDSKPISAESETELFNKVKKLFLETLPKRRQDMVKSVLIALRLGIKEETGDVELPKIGLINSKGGASTLWFKNLLGKYCNKQYKILENKALQHYGMIAIQNKINNQIDVLMISADDLNGKHLFNNSNNRQLLTGAHVKDSVQTRKPGNLALEAVNGNIHLMEVMAVLNCMPELTKNTGAKIGTIQVANPTLLQGMSASNEELLYNFHELAKHVENYEDHIEKVQFASKVELARNRLRYIMGLNGLKQVGDKVGFYKVFNSAADGLDEAINEADSRHMLRELEAIRVKLEQKKSVDITVNLDSYNEDENLAKSLYDKVLLAIAEVKGITFRQQIRDNNKFLENPHILRNGVLSLMADNPGNLNNDTLNLLTRLVTEAYLNVREDMGREVAQIRKMVADLKRDKGFTKILEMTGGNLANLFMPMIEFKNGDLLFKNPWKESVPGGEFLKYVLTKINLNRFGNRDIDIDALRESEDPKYFRVPLAVGDLASRSAVLGGLDKALKLRLKLLNPKVWWQENLERLTGVFNNTTTKESLHFYEMTNMFDRGEMDVEERLDTIAEKGLEYFEHNLETLLLKHIFAYSSQRHINNIMPMAKAAMIHLVAQGHLTNQKYENATGYVQDYIKNKIKGESLIPENLRALNAVLGKLKLASSLLMLGFSPVQFGYLTIQSLWTNLRLMFQYSGEDTPFTFENFTFAAKLVYKDLFKLGSTTSVCSLVNEYYAINDMDMNTMADKIKSDKYGIFNLTNIAYYCASRPDFFSRMMILIAQMKQDGAWEAHSVGEDGRLKYDWTKDSRFDIYAKAQKNAALKNDPKYKELEGFYLAMAEQLEKEHAMNEDGSLFKVGMPLPKAYTNQQMESYKSLADNIYGYYAHEKKAMIHALTWGSLWMLMRTFWSGKKNQYLGSPGIKLQGKYVQQYEMVKDENGKDVKEYWYLKEENGKLIPTKENTGVPLIRWEGQWLEGILLTLHKLCNEARDLGFKTTWDDLWENPENSLEQSNVKLLLFDMTMFIVVGPMLVGIMQDWDDDLMKEAKESGTVDDGAIATAAHMAMKMVSSSFGDFNFIESIGGPLTSWQPASFAFWRRRLSDFLDACMGDKDFSNFVLGMSGVTNSKIFWLNLAA